MKVLTKFRQNWPVYAIYVIMTLFALTCIFPVVNILAVSLSDKSSVMAGLVNFIPKNFNLQSYKYVLFQSAFWNSFLITVERVVLGCGINFVLTVITAYPLSKSNKEFRIRTAWTWFMFITTIISGGLIPYYILIYNVLHINDTILALVLPTALPVFNVVLLLNFFRSIPKELTESAELDGASHMVILFRIYIPLSMAPIVTVTLFTVLSHWNSWFDGMIYMDNVTKYPLATYLQRILIQKDDSFLQALEGVSQVSGETSRAAQIFVAILPIVVIYPFLQKYFEKGILIGSVKG